MTASTGLVLPERVPALAAIYADITALAANMLFERVQGGQRMSFAARRTFIEDHTIWAVDKQTGQEIKGVPYIAHVSFGGEKQRTGWIYQAKLDDRGIPKVDGEGKELGTLVPNVEIALSGKADLPNPKCLTERVSMNVRPGRITDGQGGCIEYVVIDEDGQPSAGEPMPCLFIRDFDPRTGIENGNVRAFPLGIARSETVERWNTVVARMVAQNPGNAWQAVAYIPNNIGRAVQYLQLQPRGPKSMNGLLPVYKPHRGEQVDPQKPTYMMVEVLLGKVAKLHEDSRPILFNEAGEAEDQFFLLREMWNSIELKVWGRTSDIKVLETREFEMVDVKVDALALFGTTLYTVHPGSGGALVGRALRNPPIMFMIGNGWVVPGTTTEVAQTTLQGMARLLRDRVREQVMQARQDIVHALGMGGSQASDKPTLAEILQGEKSPEALQKAVFQKEGDCPLAAWMMKAPVVQELGLPTWDWNCWTLREARKDLLMELARSQGLELPPKPEPSQDDTGNGAVASEKPAPEVKLPPRERKPRGKKAKPAEAEKPSAT
ncbi:hypothetical protein HY631_04810 [Candidatus Uhrbacteria bacterium]|nr:hypothetical protein [Candidatus Uhrbacteria bacterium]